MGRKSARVVVLGVLTGWALTVFPARGPAQEVKAEKVTFQTADGVRLHASFYPTAKKNTPTILMLHALGKDSRNAEWRELAEAFAKKGFAVLAFDFRGHGNSTEVDSKAFWLNPANAVNRSMVRGFNQAKPKEIVEFKDFRTTPGYFAYLVNDIAAAKQFLDQKNDAGQCNSHHLVLVGAETGSALGALWLRSEWQRYSVQNNGFQIVPQKKDPEGKDVIAAIWLSPIAYVGSQPASYTDVLGLPGLKAMPMVFVYGDGDAKAKGVCTSSARFFKADKKSAAKDFTTSFEVKGAKQLKGSDLLKSSLGLTDRLVEYVERVIDNKATDWSEQNSGRSAYAWILPGALRPIPVTMQMGQMPFTNYTMFLPR
jgi:alpha-beta hydrolase superfamily lysophospholipase